ncbi:hypothetical protein HDE_04180 [Halotydeus destructor]|nr:hypothetical protein HDE_04180 [Halotydeus destructor]
MTLTGVNRKRPHETNGVEEYLPISKKLNNLHIGVKVESYEANSQSSSSPHDSVQDQTNSANCYHPSLSSNQNPIYYEPNRLLYEAHLQRLNRISHKRRDGN